MPALDPMGNAMGSMIHVSFGEFSTIVWDETYADMSTMDGYVSEWFNANNGESLDHAMDVTFVANGNVALEETIYTTFDPNSDSIEEAIADVGAFVSTATYYDNTSHLLDALSHWVNSGWNEAGQMLDQFFAGVYGSDGPGKGIRVPYLPELVGRKLPLEDSVSAGAIWNDKPSASAASQILQAGAQVLSSYPGVVGPSYFDQSASRLTIHV